MNYEDSKLLGDWFALHLAISSARSRKIAVGEPIDLNNDPAFMQAFIERWDPDGKDPPSVMVGPGDFRKSRIFRAYRAWFGALSKFERAKQRRFMQDQLNGVGKIRAAIEAEGGTFDYAELDELEFSVRMAPDDSASVGDKEPS